MADIDPSWIGAEKVEASKYDQNLPVDDEIDIGELLRNGPPFDDQFQNVNE